jgi:two-component system response regulator YesN
VFQVLIVEDNVHFRNTVKVLFSSKFPKIIIAEAGDGQEALGHIDKSPPDLVFMDIELPGESGLLLTEKIRSRHPETVVAVLTAHDLPEYVQAARASGASYFFPKESTTPDDLASLIESLLREKDPSRADRARPPS